MHTSADGIGKKVCYILTSVKCTLFDNYGKGRSVHLTWKMQAMYPEKFKKVFLAS